VVNPHALATGAAARNKDRVGVSDGVLAEERRNNHVNFRVRRAGDGVNDDRDRPEREIHS